MTPGKGKDSSDRVASASVGLATAQARQRRAAATDEYDAATRGMSFTKEFSTALEAVMRDPLATVGQRFLAWLKRNSWGEYSLFAIGLDGLPKHQVDCCRELGLDKGRLSHAVAYYVARGFVRVEGKVLYPEIAPVLGPPFEKLRTSATFSKFIEHWKVANADNFTEYEVARASYDKIRKVLLSDYKKWQAAEKKAAATLLEIARDKPIDPAGSKLSPFEADERRRATAERTTQPGKQSVDGGMQSKPQAQAWDEAAAFLFSEIAAMQKAYPKSEFSQTPIDANNPDHVQLITLILKRIRAWEDADNLVGFCVWVCANFKGLGTGIRSKARAPGMSTGPTSLGLLVKWAEDYARISRLGDSAAGGSD